MPVYPLESLLPLPSASILTKKTLFRRALSLASRELSGQLDKTHPLPQAAYESLLKYFIRMSSRPTPFGCFAGVSSGALAAQTKITRQGYRLHHRLDSAYAQRLIETLESEPPLRCQLRYFSNESLYSKADRLRYLQRIQEKFVLSELSKVPASLLQLLKQAQVGLSYDCLLKRIESQGLPTSRARDLLEELIQEQLLFSELRLRPTGKPALDQLLGILKKKQGTAEHLRFLQFLKKAGPFSKKLSLETFYSPLARIKPEYQSDLFFRMQDCELSHTAASRLEPYVKALAGCVFVSQTDELKAFAERFTARYGSQAVPLLEALDHDWGVGDEQPLWPSYLEDFALTPVTQATDSLDRLTKLALSRLSVMEVNMPTITLQPEDLPQPSSPPSFFVLGSFLSSHAQALDNGHFSFHVRILQGPGFSRLLGRFACHDKQLAKQLKKALYTASEALTAEIIHLPPGRAGNVIARPILSDYEIACLGQPGVPKSRQIPLSDLLVSVNADGRIVLHSKRLKRQIIPRLSSAHNFKNGLGIYAFLSALQFQQDALHFTGDWPLSLPHAFLPRLMLGPLILYRARWQLEPAQIWPHSLPRWVCLAEGDQELVLDLHQKLCRQLLEATLEKKGSVFVYEWLQPPENCWIQNQRREHFTSEVVLLYQANSISPAASFPVLSRAQNRYSPGSSYLYVKLYGGWELLEEWLSEQLPSFLATLLRKRWFFIRYSDPEPHLRLRFHFTSAGRAARALVQLQKHLASQLSSGLLTLQVDTYEPETQRYGGPALMRVSEDWFCLESEWMLTFFQSKPSAGDRLSMAFQMMDTYLTAFELDLPTRLSLLENLEQRFFREHAEPISLRRRLQKRYRLYRPTLEESLSRPPVWKESWQQRAACSLRQIKEKGDPLSLLPHYLHMSINRLFIHHPRQHELLVYCFLSRHYASRLARSSTY